MRYDIRFTGSGGQGLLFMATTLAVAAVRFGNLHATQSASYGAATRGGYSRGDVVMCDREIDYPWLITADVLVAMAQPSLQRDLPNLKPGGVLLLEPTMVSDPSGFGDPIYRVPAMEISEKVAGSTMYANSVMLGVLDHLLSLLPKGALEQAVAAQAPARFKDGNLKAFAAGKAYHEGALSGREN